MKRTVSGAELYGFTKDSRLEAIQHDAADLEKRLLNQGPADDVTDEDLMGALRASMLLNRAVTDLATVITMRLAMNQDTAALKRRLTAEAREGAE